MKNSDAISLSPPKTGIKQPFLMRLLKELFLLCLKRALEKEGGINH